MRILAVGAHPDDIELGCGGTLALFKKYGHQVYTIVLTRGEGSGDPNLREKECRLAAATIGIDQVVFASLVDTKITDGIETITAVESQISKLAPDIVLTHSPKDVHQDHRNTYLASLTAARRIGRVLLYESPAALTEGFSPQLFVDISPVIEVKMKALAAYYSQAMKPYMNGVSDPNDPASAVAGLARFRGFQAGLPLAEAFEVSRYILRIQELT
jgi:LmbE family N-acetylglucosaminyl deacetylase